MKTLSSFGFIGLVNKYHITSNASNVTVALDSGLQSTWNGVWNVVYTQPCLTRFKRSALFSPNVAISMKNYLNHLAKVLLGGGWRVAS